jgi:hypothetical protein
MNKLDNYPRILVRSIATLLVVLAAGCRGRDPILGGGGIATLPPQVTLTVPATTIPATTGVAINTAITAAFTTDMAQATVIAPGNFTVTGPGGTAVAGAVTYASRTAIFTPTAVLAASITYTATISAAVTDVSGNALSGNQGVFPAASNYQWEFTTGLAPDTTRPRVTVTVPVTTTPGPTTGVALNSAVSAAFTEDMAPLTITAASFTLKGPGTTAVSGAVTYASRIAVFTPTAALVANTTYIGTITTAATDLAGNQLAGNQPPALPAASNYEWTFTTATGVVTPPTITLTNPANVASGVALNATVNATFSEAMDPLTLSTATFTVQPTGPPLGALVLGAVTYDALTHIATFTPTSALTASTKYTATITIGAKDLAGDALIAGLIPNPWTFTTGTGLAPGTVPLGSASTFGIMATAAITNTGAATIINGDVSLEPGTSNGLLPVQVNGTIHINDTVSHQARADLLLAYNFAKALPPGVTISGGADLGALYLTGIPPGTYTSGSTMLVSTPLILDAGGNANAVWVFQIGSSLTTTANVSLAHGAQAKNVFWVPTLDATVGVGSTFYGTIVAGRDTTAKTGAVINGRILTGATLSGTIALDTNTVNVPAP